jgi:quinol monooxygenase YgiN
MANWVQDANCFVSRFHVDPARRDEFVTALNELLAFAGPWYEEGCNFAFHGWARDPNVWVAIASWKDEEILQRLRQAPVWQDTQRRMLAACDKPMVMEQFAGMKRDRSVFDLYPAGASKVHQTTENLGVVWL